MRFFSSLTVVAALLLGANACKCVRGGADNAATEACCAQIGGEFVGGDDCRADSISESLSNFRDCCGESQLTSDCDCPTCLQEGLEAKTYVQGGNAEDAISNCNTASKHKSPQPIKSRGLWYCAGFQSLT